MDIGAILILLSIGSLIFMILHHSIETDQYERNINRLMKDNKRIKAELSEMTRLMDEQFAMRADAMNAGKALLREAMLAQQQSPAKLKPSLLGRTQPGD